MPPLSANAELPLPGTRFEVVVRFANTLPDLNLEVEPDARLATAASLKSLIRVRLPLSLAKCRLRLIQSGRLLSDRDTISTDPGRRRGVLEVYDAENDENNQSGSNQKTYIHCSIGDELPAEELEKKINDAQMISKTQAQHEQTRQNQSSSHLGYTESSTHGHGPNGSTEFEGSQPLRPQGFDQLLTQGFSQDDIATLRATFLSSLAQSRPTSQLPTGDELRLLEDRWLESTAFDESDDFGNDDGVIGSMDDLLIGFGIGFFWPVAGVWAFGENGMWSERRQSAIWIGVFANVVFGFIRYITFKMEGT